LFARIAKSLSCSTKFVIIAAITTEKKLSRKKHNLTDSYLENANRKIIKRMGKEKSFSVFFNQKGFQVMSAIIKSVEKGSIAQKHNISAGDILLKINGNIINDVLDYRFYITDSKVNLEIQFINGKIKNVVFEKDEYDDIGLEFNSYLIDEKQSCHNKCIFCFIDQLPKGMRESLYFKDDDSRLSFLMGNYITLTNFTEHDIQRIIDMHISPFNISIHTTNPELRCMMMNNKNAGNALQIMRRLSANNIKTNCQIVLCKGINDGDELDRSLTDLSLLFPSVESIAVVPVGLTKYRQGLFELSPFDCADSLKVIQQIEKFGQVMQQKHGTRLAFAADEFYLRAAKQIPDLSFYEDVNQLENGVGLLALLTNQIEQALKSNDLKILNKKRTISIATGKAAYDFIKNIAENVMNNIAGLSCLVYAIENEFFGENVDVAGLVTGGDLIRQLKGRELGEQLLFPAVMLRFDRDVFLDDISIKEVEMSLDVKATPVEVDGFELLDTMLGLNS
jgi:putative radical SAM enzyme (TIGR03279 family)